MNRWSAQVNDLVGGWIVTTYPRPLAEHDPARRGEIIAECASRKDAEKIVDLLNLDEQADFELRTFLDSEGGTSGQLAYAKR